MSDDSSRPRRAAEALPEVDLHGCTVESGERRLEAALARWRAGGVSRARVVTGKGYGSTGGIAKLAPAVESWLRSEGRAYGVAEVRVVAGGGAFELTIERGA